MHAVSLSLRRLSVPLLIFLVVPAWAASHSAIAGDISVVISTVRDHNGEIICALFDSEESFEKRAPLVRVVARPEIPATTCVFRNVKAGTYAVTAIHDENDNGRLDKTFFGRPTEGYGVSNNHTYAMRAPRFSESTFSFSGNHDLSIAIHLRYP